MQRIPCAERPDWREKAEAEGFGFHTMYGDIYWDESAYYRFTLAQIENDLEDPSAELHAMCLHLVDEVVQSEALLSQLAIPEPAWDLLRDSWRRRDPSLYARFDLAYDGRGAAKLFELNYDTPTSLFESAFFQWQWLEDQKARGLLLAHADQFNSLHERLRDTIADLPVPLPIYFAAMRDNEEDHGTVIYLQDVAAQAAIPARGIAIEDIGVNADGQFTDLDDVIIPTLFKLYPWEDLLAEDFAVHLRTARTRFIEPLWKLVLSNKGALALLWQRHEGHPNLLPAYMDAGNTPLAAGWVRKPFFSREGANVELHAADGRQLHVTGPYGHGPFVRQQCHLLPEFSGNYPLIGSWVIGDHACGIGIREDRSLITHDMSRFVPHVILD